MLTPDERESALKEMLESEAWQEVARPALEQRARSIELRVMTYIPPDLPNISRLQGEYRVLRALLDTPDNVLLPIEEEG